MSAKSMCGMRDGDLQPGVYTRLPDGTLVPANKIFTNDPPRPINVSSTGQITNVTHTDMDYLKDEVLKHYELKSGHSLTTKKSTLSKFRDMCNRAADYVMGDR